MMTVYDKILTMSKEQMAEYLYSFANAILDAFSNYVTPSKDMIMELLECEVKNDGAG